jgi:hypothetical protein
MNASHDPRTKRLACGILSALMTASALAFPACSGPKEPIPSIPPIGGWYGPVTHEHLIGVRVCLGGSVTNSEFVWAFSQHGFAIKGNDGPIPQDVLDAVLGEGSEARLIEGKWELAGPALILSEIRADNVGGFAEVRLKMFLTGPSVVRVNLGGSQYVLGPARG